MNEQKPFCLIVAAASPAFTLACMLFVLIHQIEHPSTEYHPQLQPSAELSTLGLYGAGFLAAIASLRRGESFRGWAWACLIYYLVTMGISLIAMLVFLVGYFGQRH